MRPSEAPRRSRRSLRLPSRRAALLTPRLGSVLLALSLMWFVPITNGLLKALGLKKTGSKAWGSFVNLEKKDKEA